MIITPTFRDHHHDNIQKLLTTAFPNAEITITQNPERLCFSLIYDDDNLVACGSAYIREMEQNKVKFKGGIIAGVAVHPNYTGRGLCRLLITSLNNQLKIHNVKHSFLFAYEPRVYRSSGYTLLRAPIHFYDIPPSAWRTFIYRGGMVKTLSGSTLNEDHLIDFKGCVY